MKKPLSVATSAFLAVNACAAQVAGREFSLRFLGGVNDSGQIILSRFILYSNSAACLQRMLEAAAAAAR